MKKTKTVTENAVKNIEEDIQLLNNEMSINQTPLRKTEPTTTSSS